MSRSVLLIDDDTQVLSLLEKAFRRAGYSVMSASRGGAGIALYARDASDLVVLDLNMPDRSGIEVIGALQEIDPDVSIIMLTGQADVATAVEAMRAGAENFLPKPVNIAHLYAAADRAFEKTELRRRTGYLEARDRSEGAAHGGERSPALAELDDKVGLLAPTDSTVLLLGETGTGKSYTARHIHAQSPRANKPFVEVNAAALTPTFLDSELFGHEKGAFTDAKTMKRGLFEVADGGTLFLDEVGDLASELQPKLLHAIETGRFRRIGGTRELETDVRVIAATNRNLDEAVRTGAFREDLYYRLAVMPLTLPPLRKRGDAEIARLAAEVLDRLPQRVSGVRKELSPEALARLTRYTWPGNIREVRNVLERALILAAQSPRIEPHHLPMEVGRNGPTEPSPTPEVEVTLAELERRHIYRVLAHCEDNRTRAAEILGLSRVGLYKKLKRMEADAA